MNKETIDARLSGTGYQKEERHNGSGNKLLVIGQSTIDDIFREGEGFVFMRAPGGDAIYSALGASVWPIPISVVSLIGDDYPFEKLEKVSCHPELTNWGGLKYYGGPTIHDTAYYYLDGSRKYIFEDEALLHTLSPRPADIPESFLGCSHVHISAANANAQLELLKFFKETNRPVSLDVENHFITGYEPAVLEMISLDPIFIPSLEHVLLLSGIKERSPIAIWPWIKEMGLSLTVVKCGGDGAWVFDARQKECWTVGVVPGLKIADVTGAGDAFCGGFMAGLIETGNPVLAATYGSVSASFIVETWAAIKPPHHSLELAKSRLEQVTRLLPDSPILLP